MDRFVVILVFSTSHAIHAERVLTRGGFDVKLIPTPRHLSSDCGSAVRIAADAQAKAEQALIDAGVTIDRIERLED